MSVEQTIDCLILVAALLVALITILFAIGPVRRLASVKTTRTADLKPGIAEIAGTARLTGEALASLDGSPLVATRREMYFTYKSSSKKAVRSTMVRDIQYAPFEVVDESGACPVEVGAATVLGPSREWRFSPDAFKERHLALYERLAVDSVSQPYRVYVEETMIADGGVILVSGRAVPSGAMAAGEGYRGVRERMKVVAPEDGPMLLSGWSESDTRRRFMRPVWISILLALLSVAIGALVIGARVYVEGIAHL